MLVTLNEKGKIEIGYLKAKDKYNLVAYRDSLLEKNPTNFKVREANITKELNIKDQYKEKFYPKDEKIVHEKLLEVTGYTIPFEIYTYLYSEKIIECQNPITIQILTRVLRDWYRVEKDEYIGHFVRHGIMKLLYTLPDISLQLPDPTKSHIGMHKLLEPGREADLKSFQNSLGFLEFYVSKELAFEDILKLQEKKIEYLSLNTPLNEIIANSEILFGKNKIKKINR